MENIHLFFSIHAMQALTYTESMNIAKAPSKWLLLILL
jgi:hypothetical protein